MLCQISGWGQNGPLSQAAGHDLNYLAAMGLLSHTGRADDPPALIPMQVADSASGLFAATSILAALRERRHSGRGQRVDVSIAHCALTLASMTVAGALGTREPRPAPEGVSRARRPCPSSRPTTRPTSSSATSRALLRHHATHGDGWQVAVREARFLSEEHQRQVLDARHDFEQIWYRVLREGAEAGLWRPVDGVDVRGVLGMFNYTARWMRPDGTLAPQQIADRSVDLLLNGLKRPAQG